MNLTGIGCGIIVGAAITKSLMRIIKTVGKGGLIAVRYRISVPTVILTAICLFFLSYIISDDIIPAIQEINRCKAIIADAEIRGAQTYLGRYGGEFPENEEEYVRHYNEIQREHIREIQNGALQQFIGVSFILLFGIIINVSVISKSGIFLLGIPMPPEPFTVEVSEKRIYLLMMNRRKFSFRRNEKNLERFRDFIKAESFDVVV